MDYRGKYRVCDYCPSHKSCTYCSTGYRRDIDNSSSLGVGDLVVGLVAAEIVEEVLESLFD